MPAKKIVALGGDGAGPEVMEVTCHLLKEAGFGLTPICNSILLDADERRLPGSF